MAKDTLGLQVTTKVKRKIELPSYDSNLDAATSCITSTSSYTMDKELLKVSVEIHTMFLISGLCIPKMSAPDLTVVVMKKPQVYLEVS